MSKHSGSSSSMNRKMRTRPCRSARKARTRKPKFLSLRLQLSAEEKRNSDAADAASREVPGLVPESATTNSDGICPQLTLFPLHPENSIEECTVAYDLFSAAESDATTITALLGAPSTSASSGEDHRNSAGKNAFSSSDSLRFPYGCRGAALARAALRCKERKPCEEKWVCYSEVVENERKEEEVTSCAAAADPTTRLVDRRRLSLKLDYQGIINAWSDKGPLYIQSESPQTVPDIIHDDFLFNGIWSGWESNMRVPEMAGNDGAAAVAEEGGEESAGQSQRAASVLRYKEKRRNRLFSKTIRYQVRKLNAEKRPRVKGRFVKRD